MACIGRFVLPLTRGTACVTSRRTAFDDKNTEPPVFQNWQGDSWCHTNNRLVLGPQTGNTFSRYLRVQLLDFVKE
jgi:hypothetical protein